ncbi:MAG: hypothetical protein QM705_04365 [Ancrocorticia sp.]
MSPTLAAPVLGEAPVLTPNTLEQSVVTDAPVPTLVPPSEAVDESELSAKATISGKAITALYSDAFNRNFWLHVNGVGWKKVSQATDSGATSIALIGALAKAMNRAPTMNDDASGIVQDIVVW